MAPSGQRSTKSGSDSPNHNRVAVNSSLSQAPSTLGAFAESYSNKEETSWVYGDRGRMYGGNEMHSQHGPYRGNNGPQARPDGSYHHRHGGRRDPHRREGFASHKRDGSRPFVRGPAPNRPYVPPPPPPVVMRPFVNPMVYHGMFADIGIMFSCCFISADDLMNLAEMPQVFYVPGPHLDSPRPMPMVSYSPMLFPMPDPHLLNKILIQIDYYFRYLLLVFSLHYLVSIAKWILYFFFPHCCLVVMKTW